MYTHWIYWTISFLFLSFLSNSLSLFPALKLYKLLYISLSYSMLRFYCHKYELSCVCVCTDLS